MQQANSQIMIPVFDGKEYANWKIRLIKFLQFKKCNEVITKKIDRTADVKLKENWLEKDVQATNYIYGAITNKQLEYIAECESAYDIICKFDSMYLKSSTSLQIVYRNNLENIKLKNYAELNLFFDEFERSVNELKQAGATISESEKLNYMLRALPNEYSHIGDLIDVLPKEDRTVEYLMSKIKIKYLAERQSTTHEKTEAPVDNSNAFKTETKSVPNSNLCFICGKPGHMKRNCWYNRGQQNRGTNYNRGQSHSTHRSRGRGFNNRGRGFSHRGRGRNFYQNASNTQNEQSNFHTSVIQNNNITSLSENKSSKNEITWLLDSGCTDHIINSDEHFERSVTLKNPIKVKVGDGRMLEATKVGDIKLYFPVYGSRSYVNVTNVFYVKDMKANLLSCARITDNNNTVVSKGHWAKIYTSNGKLSAIAQKQERLYRVISYIENSKMHANVSKSTMSMKEKLHRTLGHVNFKYLDIMCKNQLLEGIPKEIESEYMKCAICIENKMHNLSFKNNRRRAEDILEIVHTDVNGPHNTTGYGGEKYFVTFIDDYSKLAKVYCIKAKDQVADCFMEYVNAVQNLTGKMIKELRCDNGREYMNNKMYSFAREKGIMIKACPPYVHELNGTAERYNRTIMDMARCLLAEAKVNRCYWPEVIKAAAYLKNRSLANTIVRKTPYEIFFNKKPSLKELKLYGSRVYVRIPEVNRRSKWDKKAELGILLGYVEVGYKVLINNRIIVARHVDIIEEDVMCMGNNDDTDSEEERQEEEIIENNLPKETQVIDPCCDEYIKYDDDNEDEEPKRTKRQTKRPVRFDDEFGYNCICANFCDAMIPGTFQEAIQCDEANKWKEAMDREMASLVKNNTWTLVSRPERKEILDVKWVYKRKPGNIYKARLVVRGFQQKDNIDDTYSPVAKMQTLKLLLSYSCQYSFHIHQMDVETAFLNGKVVSEVYVKQPQGYNDVTNKVYKLNKALYGLKESPRAWYECFNDFIEKLGFYRSKYDYCLYIKRDNNVTIYILVYVDDLLICCRDVKVIIDIKKQLNNKFKMKDLNKVKNYIGIDIEYDYDNSINVLTLCQKNYIDSLAEKYNIKNSKLYKTPMELNLKLNKSNINEDVKYRNLIGALLYISQGTRPDISYSVNYLSRFQNCYNETHFKYALRVLKYLYLTKELKLTYRQSLKTDNIVNCYVDADWAGDITDRKSTTGFVIELFGNPIYCKSRKQSCVTKSSTFAEYVALSDAVTEIIFFKNVISDMFIRICRPIKIYEDNSGALAIAKYGNFTKNSKHIEVQYHYVHENYKNKVIEIVKIDSDSNVADILTKSLGKIKFLKFREKLKLE
ncbi:hypothetical protein PYW07_010878 [Mythimna separata]|uniref:Retrovirus-related Pol polyprotein from transposon TNT 1-94 n=1 Tax=Mythimna separata TaxID=271217 RepID=A0AAD7Y839_MYTSE|nr:hypothetical protein PYW07_010878 [Mythimna separata]